MDLNDPRRRLQVLNQSNPSLRASVAPQPQLKVQTSLPQQLTIQTGDQNRGASPSVTINRDPNARTQAPDTTPFQPEKSTTDLGLDFLKHSASGIVDSTVKPFAEGVARLLPGGQADLQANQDAIASSNANQKVYDDLYKAGKITPDQYSKFLQGISADASANSTEATRIAGTADKSRFLGSAAQVAALPFLGAAEGATSLAGRVGLGAAEGGAMGLANEFSANNDPTLKGAAINTGIGAVAGGALPFLGALKNKIMPSAATAGISKETLNQLKGSNDVLEIFSKLQDEKGSVDPAALLAAAEKIAQSDNGKFIIKELTALPEQGIGAAATGVIAGNEVAKAKYGQDVLTGDSAEAHVHQIPQKEGTINLDPPAPNDGSPIRLNASKVTDEAFAKANDEALKELGMTPQETPQNFKQRVEAKQAENQTSDLSTAIKANVSEVAKDPAIDQSMQDAFLKTGIQDPYNLLVNTISENGNKSEIRSIVDKLVGGNGDQNLKNRLTTKLTKAKTPQEVHDIIDAETAAAKAATEAPMPAPNTPQAAEKAIEAVPQQNGTVAPEVAADGSTVAPKTEAASSPEQVSTPVNKAADSAAKESTPVNAAHEELLSKLDEAALQHSADAKIYSKQLGQKFAKGTGAYEQTGGLEGYKAKLGAMKGKKVSGFQPLQVSDETANALLDHVQGLDMQPAQKLNAQTAILKVIGHSDGAPTPGDIRYIRDAFGGDVADAVEQNLAQAGLTGKEKLAMVASTPKAAMATADLSAPLRQGGVLGSRFPKEWGKAAAESTTYFKSQANYDKAMKEIADRPTYELMKKAGLAVDGANGITGTEEQFMSSLLETDVAKKLQFGRVTAASDRGYTGFLTKLRADVFDKIVGDAGLSLKEIPEGASKELTASIKAENEPVEKALKSLGEFINSASGRGNLGSLERHAGLLSKALFSPRLWKSRLDLLNPVYYAKLDPIARKYALQSSATFASTAATVLGLAAAAGATVIYDPRSADFAKIKVGNTRYDILGGLQQNIRLGAQLITGEKINSSTGELQTLGDGITTPSRKDLLYQFFENKENPIVGYASKLLDGKDAGGNPINPATEGAKLLIPLNFQSVYETAKDQGSLKDPKNLGKSTAMNLPGVFGAGVQTYGNVPTKDQGTNAEGKTVFKGKQTPDMVTDDQGNVLTDAKGKPIKVSVPKDANGQPQKFEDLSKTEQRALTDSKRSSALSDRFKKTLSSEDQALLKLSDDKLKGYVKDGTIDQAHYDRIQNYQKTADSVSKSNSYKVPDGITTPEATAFYHKFNSMDEKDQKAWLKQAPDDNAKTIATSLNGMKAAGLSDFKPSNELSKAYAEYEKDINTHPEYTAVDKQNKGKAFQVFSAKLNYNDSVKDIYNEGGNTDLKTLMSEKQISQEDLNNAIQLDNELYTSGLTGSLKFSKKFRNSMGIATPNGVGGASGGSGGSSSASDYHGGSLSVGSLTNNPAATKLPEFSTKSRGIKFAPPANIAKGASNSKRISIKL